MGKIIDCKTLSQKIKDDVKERVDKLKEKGINPKLTVLTNPDDEPSKAYVRNKKRVCEEVGIEFEEIPFNRNIEYKKLLQVANANNPVVVQLPINKDVDTEVTWEVINDYYCCPERDVDGFFKDAFVKPATAKGVMKIFDYKNLNTYVNRRKVLKAMLTYNRYHWRDGDTLSVDSVETYTSTLLRFWDWGYKNIVDEETYLKIKGLIK